MRGDPSSRVIRYSEVAAFARDVEPFLVEHEAANNLPLGIISNRAASPAADASGYYLAVAQLDGAVGAVAIHTPGFNLVLSFPDAPESAVLLAEDLHARASQLPGVLGPRRTVEAFAARWADLSRMTTTEGTPQLIYELRRVHAPSAVPGRFRPVGMTDRAFMVGAFVGFRREIEGRETTHQQAESEVDAALSAPIGRFFVWDDQGPVSMAAATGSTPHGIRINSVYTPPDHRRRGYASACVAALSQRLLDEGRRFCFLFTDARNPTSNAIYQRIGYELVTEVRELCFERPTGVQ